MGPANIRIYICTGETGRWNTFFSKGTITYSRPDSLCVFNNFLKNPFWPLLASNASETPRDRWHYEANAGWSACVVVLLWRKRSGLATSMTRRRFPGVSNGRHQISSQPFFNFCQEVLWYGRFQIRRSIVVTVFFLFLFLVFLLSVIHQ